MSQLKILHVIIWMIWTLHHEVTGHTIISLEGMSLNNARQGDSSLTFYVTSKKGVIVTCPLLLTSDGHDKDQGKTVIPNESKKVRWVNSDDGREVQFNLRTARVMKNDSIQFFPLSSLSSSLYMMRQRHRHSPENVIYHKNEDVLGPPSPRHSQITNNDHDIHKLRCSVQNEYGIQLSPVIKVIPYLPTNLPMTELVKIVSDTNVFKGNRATLKCQVHSSIKPFVNFMYWIRSRHHGGGDKHIYPYVRYDDRYLVESGNFGDLNIFKIDHSDTIDTFSCRIRIKNSAFVPNFGHSSSNFPHDIYTTEPFTMKVKESEKVIEPKQSKNQNLFYTVNEGETAILACNVISNPPPVFSWFKVTENLLQPVPRSSQLTWKDGILNIQQATKLSDEGEYRCTARNDQGEISITVHLQVLQKWILDINPSRQIINLGRQATISCSIRNAVTNSSINNEMDILWYKDGKILDSNERQSLSNRKQKLKIYNLQHSDYGIYQCMVRQSFSNAKHNIEYLEDRKQEEHIGSSELRLGDTTPLLTYRFIDQTIQPGGVGVVLKCAARGSPVPSISWLFNGNRLDYEHGKSGVRSRGLAIDHFITIHGEVISNVNITRVRPRNGGHYKCIASNRAGHISHSARLNVYGPPFIHEMEDEHAILGRSHQIICPISGYPIDKVTWAKDSTKIDDHDRRYRMFFNGTLVIKKVGKNDKGMYSCTATNREGLKDSESTNLDVLVTPQIAPLTFPHNVTQGKRLRAICTVTDGDKPISVTWYKDNHPLGGGRDSRGFHTTPSSPGIQMMMMRSEDFADTHVKHIDEFTSLLAISRVGVRHAGNYSCIAKNHYAQAIRSAMLVVRVPPEWVVEPPSKLSSVEHEDISLACSASGVPTPKITWIKLTDPKSRRHSTFFQDNRLHNQHSRFPKEVVEFQLNSERPRFKNYEFQANGTLRIMRVEKEENEGRYICSAWNGVIDGSGSGGHSTSQNSRGDVDSASLEKHVKLIVNAPPKFDSRQSRTVSGRTGEVIELVCQASGDENIGIKWLQNNNEFLTVPGSSSTTEIRELDKVTSRLTLNDISKMKNDGVYTCLAENEFGTSRYEIQVSVWEPPPTPENVTILEISSRTVKLEWDIQNDISYYGDKKSEKSLAGLNKFNSNPPIDQIIVQWKKFDENWFPDGQQRMLNGNYLTMNFTIITGLHPWTAYHIRLFAENKLGRSKNSKVIQFVTDGENPSGVASQVRVMALSSTSLEVSWDDPDERLQHGVITRYNVGYRRFDTKSYEFVSVDKFDFDSAHTKFVLHRLSKFERYEIILQVVNEFGEGPLTQPILGQTAQDIPDGVPNKVHCLSLTSTTIQVNWQPPDSKLRNGIIKGYKIFYGPVPSATLDNSLPFPKLTRLSSLSTVLDGLRKFTNYTIQVLAMTSAGDGPFSDTILCKTHADVPGPPQDIKAVVKSSTSIVVSWLEPHSTNGAVQEYHIYVRPKQNNGRNHAKYNRDASVSQLIVDNLYPNTAYQFWVTAVNSVGEGMSSKVVTLAPTLEAPARTTALSKTLYVNNEVDREEKSVFPLYLDCSAVGHGLISRQWFSSNGYSIQNQQDDKLVVVVDSRASKSDKSSSNSVSQSGLFQQQGDRNYSCHVENEYGRDSVHYSIIFQYAPTPPVLEVMQTTFNSITVRWTTEDDGNSPIIKSTIYYKTTYGDWFSEQVGWHQNEKTLHQNIVCGREYHIYVVVKSAIGLSSRRSDTAIVRSDGDRPSGPLSSTSSISSSFITPNVTFVQLNLDLWKDGGCPILYFVIEYKMIRGDKWVTVTNDLPPQLRYNVVGLQADTEYHIKVSAHNHAGSTSIRYTVQTLTENVFYNSGRLSSSDGWRFSFRGGGEGVSRVESGGGIWRSSSDGSGYTSSGSLARAIYNLFGVGIRTLTFIVISTACVFVALTGICLCMSHKQAHDSNTATIAIASSPANTARMRRGRHHHRFLSPARTRGGDGSARFHMESNGLTQHKNPPFYPLPPPFGNDENTLNNTNENVYIESVGHNIKGSVPTVNSTGKNDFSIGVGDQYIATTQTDRPLLLMRGNNEAFDSSSTEFEDLIVGSSNNILSSKNNGKGYQQLHPQYSLYATIQRGSSSSSNFGTMASNGKKKATKNGGKMENTPILDNDFDSDNHMKLFQMQNGDNRQKQQSTVGFESRTLHRNFHSSSANNNYSPSTHRKHTPLSSKRTAGRMIHLPANTAIIDGDFALQTTVFGGGGDDINNRGGDLIELHRQNGGIGCTVGSTTMHQRHFDDDNEDQDNSDDEPQLDSNAAFNVVLRHSDKQNNCPATLSLRRRNATNPSPSPGMKNKPVLATSGGTPRTSKRSNRTENERKNPGSSIRNDDSAASRQNKHVTDFQRSKGGFMTSAVGPFQQRSHINFDDAVTTTTTGDEGGEDNSSENSAKQTTGDELSSSEGSGCSGSQQHLRI